MIPTTTTTRRKHLLTLEASGVSLTRYGLGGSSEPGLGGGGRNLDLGRLFRSIPNGAAIDFDSVRAA